MTGDVERELDERSKYSPSTLLTDSLAGELIDGMVVVELARFGSEFKNQAPDFFHI